MVGCYFKSQFQSFLQKYANFWPLCVSLEEETVVFVWNYFINGSLLDLLLIISIISISKVCIVCTVGGATVTHLNESHTDFACYDKSTVWKLYLTHSSITEMWVWIYIFYTFLSKYSLSELQLAVIVIIDYLFGP